MKVQGSDCSIIIKTAHCEKYIPYTDETLREEFLILKEEASIEGDGACRAIVKSNGLTGCVVTPLTNDTAPMLLSLAMGSACNPVYVSGTKNLYQYSINLLPMEDTESFIVIQKRSLKNVIGQRKLYENCRVKGFELRILRNETIKLKLDLTSNKPPVKYPYLDTCDKVSGKRYEGENVTYELEGKAYQNIYGITVLSKKEGGTRTEVWIKRILKQEGDLPYFINKLEITANLNSFDSFRITIEDLLLITDETNINSADTVIGPLRYYVSGTVSAEVFSVGEETII